MPIPNLKCRGIIMCHAILKVQYHNDKEPSAFLEIDSEDTLSTKLEEVKVRPGVKKVSVYHFQYSHELVSEWRVQKKEDGE